MAKSDLLKEAIADARAVKETALANAKIALQEAFAPRIHSMLSAKLSEELEDEELPADDTMGADVDLEAGNEELPVDGEMGADVGDLSIDVDNNGEFDEFDIFSKEPMGGVEDEMGAPAAEEPMDVNPEDEYNEGYDHEDELNLEAIIRELEGDVDNEMPDDLGLESEPADEMDDMDEDMNIDEIIESILREDEFSAEQDLDVPSTDEDGIVSDLQNEVAEKEEELQEAYKTVHQLKSIINEVNLLNAKLLYTNKLFRNFELNESQKMKVIENFDRAGNTREVKLVFTTLAESFNRPTTKKRVVKESYASKATATTKPSTTIISEGFDQAERWKKLAGLL